MNQTQSEVPNGPPSVSGTAAPSTKSKKKKKGSTVTVTEPGGLTVTYLSNAPSNATYYCMSFTHTFDRTGDVCYFAFSLPYTYTDLQRYLHKVILRLSCGSERLLTACVVDYHDISVHIATTCSVSHHRRSVVSPHSLVCLS